MENGPHLHRIDCLYVPEQNARKNNSNDRKRLSCLALLCQRPKLPFRLSILRNTNLRGWHFSNRRLLHIYHNNGWAIHYFEEESIEGTLYTIDGAEYKPTVKRVESNAVKAKPEPKKQENVQFSFFDNLTEQEVKEHETDNSSVDTDENEVIEQNGNDEQTPVASNTPNGTFFEKYQALQQQNPAYVIAYRLGDFYEILGDKAVEVAREIDLTLTSRDCGLEERVPMIGFPYHAAEIYFARIAKTHDLLVVETDGSTRFISQNGGKKTTQIDYETGEILGEALEPNDTVISKLFEIFGNTLEIK